jgi:surface antigen
MSRCALPLLLAALSGLAACSAAPIGGGTELDSTTTGSIARVSPPTEPPLGYAATPAEAKAKTVIDGVAPSDWERIRLFASTSLAGARDGDVLDWTNPQTGSNGTLAALAASRPEAGSRDCRAFALTISDVRGIRRYRGDACRTPDGMWQLFDVTPEDGALL